METAHSMEGNGSGSGSERRSAAGRIGTGLAMLGILLMVLMGWLYSWWMVPALRDGTGRAEDWLFVLWSVSTPLGGLLFVVGAGIMIRRSWLRVAWLTALGILVFLSIQYVRIPHVTPPLFGIGGGIIMASFLGIVWTLTMKRRATGGRDALAADIQIVGYFFLLIAAWYLCGLLGTPFLLLRPDNPLSASGSAGATALASTILVFLSLGWALVFVGYFLSPRSPS